MVNGAARMRIPGVYPTSFGPGGQVVRWIAKRLQTGLLSDTGFSGPVTVRGRKRGMEEDKVKDK